MYFTQYVLHYQPKRFYILMSQRGSSGCDAILLYLVYIADAVALHSSFKRL